MEQNTPILNRALVRAILILVALAAFAMAAGAPICPAC